MKILMFILISLVMGCMSMHSSPQVHKNFKTDISTKGLLFDVDKLGNVYVLNQLNQVLKYNSEGKQIAIYSGSQVGEIEFIDASNPHKILLFIPDIQQLIIVDNTLSEIGRKDLSTISNAISNITNANNNNILIYDNIDSKIKEIDQNGNVINISPPMSDIARGLFNATYLNRVDNFTYCYDPNVGTIILDYNLNIIRLDQQKGFHVVDAVDHNLITIEGKTMQSVELMVNLDSQTIPKSIKKVLLQDQILDVKKESNIWYVLYSNGIVRYKTLEFK